MKALLALILTIALVFFVGRMWLDEREDTSPENSEEENSQIENNSVEVANGNSSDNETEQESEEINGEVDLHEWIGRDNEEVHSYYGEPDRIDETPFGYEWHVYSSEGLSKQIGIDDGEVVTVYTNSQDVALDEIEIGEDYESIHSLYHFDQEQIVREGLQEALTFELTEEDIQSRPLVKIDDNLWVQLYFDTFNQELSSVRYMEEETLIIHRPYSVTYRGDLPMREEWEDEEKLEEWQRGQENQILELTNGIREKHGLASLEWHEEISKVAYFHSKEMYEEEYFSHTSPLNGELSDRLEQGQISYQLAAENIAANYVDGIEAVEGWLNSEGHRVNLLNEELSHLGVGVYRDYYTQNFLTPM